jgi:hypothetical protein
VEDKTEYKDRQIDGWENQLAVFSLKFYFEKDTFLPVKLKLGRKEGSEEIIAGTGNIEQLPDQY